jgi:hypothetical protein
VQVSLGRAEGAVVELGVLHTLSSSKEKGPEGPVGEVEKIGVLGVVSVP